MVVVIMTVVSKACVVCGNVESISLVAYVWLWEIFQFSFGLVEVGWDDQFAVRIELTSVLEDLNAE